MNTNTKTKATTAYPLVICGVFAAVMVVCSWIAIPLPSGVPINLAVLGVLLSAGCLGFRYGTLTQLVYVLLGCVGLPVFAGFNGGLHVIAGPTGGYIVGYILCAGIVGFIASRTKSFWALVGAMILGLSLIHIYTTDFKKSKQIFRFFQRSFARIFDSCLKIEVFSFLETASLSLLYCLYCLRIVYARGRFQKYKIFYFLKVVAM